MKTKVPNREAIGSLLYLAGGTRPDISYAVNIQSRSQSNTTSEEVLRLFQYLRGTTQLGLKYPGTEEGFKVETDTSSGDWSDSTSTAGFLMILFGDPIACRSYKQRYVNQSTGKTAYRAMSDACREITSQYKGLREITGVNYFPATL